MSFLIELGKTYNEVCPNKKFKSSEMDNKKVRVRDNWDNETCQEFEFHFLSSARLLNALLMRMTT